ncbi:GDSL-type esterase/lipase family protein [Terriglobus sp.]|uniref:GDSL-type esterase/lipase family protein n=1 Tax=Terriglobus sp. TaxID=1889013 RepID=UPI003AFFBB92
MRSLGFSNALWAFLGFGILAHLTLLSGCASSSSAGTIATPPAVQIVTQPRDQSVQAGQSVTFSVEVSQPAAAHFQWFANGQSIADATSSSYTIASPNVSQSGTSLYVAVSAGSGPINSYGATLTVLPLQPTLSFAPLPSTTFGAGAVTLYASSASAAPVSYTVISGPAALSGSTLTATGAGTVVLAASQQAAGNYTAAVAQTSITVAPATPSLRFAAVPPLAYGVAPFPVSATSASDGAVAYSILSGPATIVGNQVSITGAGPVVLLASQAASTNFTTASAQTSFTVGPNVTLSPITPADITIAPGQQRFNTTAVGGARNTVTWSANGGSFSGSTWTSPTSAGTYTITATSADQPDRSVSTTVRTSAPVITTQPVGTGVCSAGPLSLSVAAQYAAGYQWYLNSQPISGAGASTFSLSAAASNTDAGVYTVAVTNPAGSVLSEPATVSVGSELTAQPTSATVVVPQTAAFSVAAQGQEPFSYQWFSVSPASSTPTPVPGATSSRYAPPSIATADSARYFATVTDRCGAVLTSNQATLTVQSAPIITAQPSLAPVAVASTPTLQVAVAGNPALSYQWYWTPSGLHGAIPIAGATLRSYTLPATATTNGNNGDTYYVVVKNTLGQATSIPVPLATTSADAAKQWVVSWGASPENAIAGPQNPPGTNQSFRSVFYPTVTGTTERVHFSNLFNTAPVTIGAARLAVSTSNSAIDPTHDQPLTFQGQTTLTLAPGQETVSDPVQVPYTLGQKLAVSLYVFGSYPSLTQHESQVNVNFATPSGAGNTTTDAAGGSFTQANTEWFVLSGLDVYGTYQGTVALFGSSSIDGHGSNYGNTNAYPVYNVPIDGQDNDRPSDWLARQLTAAGFTMGVLNAGTIGNPAGRDARSATGVTVAGVDRFDHDVLQQAGIKTVVIYTGGIDLRGDCVPATNVEASLTAIIGQASAAGVRVILGTLPPSEYCLSVQPLPNSTYPYNGDLLLGPLNPSPENPGSTQRRLLNTWIRNVAPSLPGVVGIADFDSVLADPNHPDFMIPNYISSDPFHPNGVGYGVQSSAIPLNLVLP